MKFFVDENVERKIIVALREKHEVIAVDEIMKGAADAVVLKRAADEETILITADKDFGELIYSSQQLHTGVVLYRLHGLPIDEKIRLLTSAIDNYGADLLHAFTVITQQNIRIRKQ